MARNFILCCILAALLYKEAAATGGGYAAEGSYAAIYSRNTWVESKFPVFGNVQPGMKVTSVFWTYSPSYIPPGFQAILCWNNKSTCMDITTFGSGSTFTHFTGLSATVPFAMYFQVSGSGRLNAVHMSNLRLSVNYDV